MDRQRLGALVLLGCLCASAQAGVYRWVDERGGAVYSQTPPPSGDSVRLEQPPAPNARESNAARERLKALQQKTSSEQEQRKEAAAEKEKQAQEQARRATNCTAVRENLQTLKNLGPRRVRMPDGEIVRLSEQQVRSQTDKAQLQAEEYCD